MRRVALLAVVVVAVAARAHPVLPVAASCAGLAGPGSAATLRAQLADAPAVFVGTVLSTSDHDRIARVRVESVWKGSPVPALVTVSGTPEPDSAATSVDRTFRAEQRYLFAPSSPGSPFQDNSCSATQAYSPALAALQPATARPPQPGSDGLAGDSPAPLLLWPWSAAALGMAIGGLGWWWLLVRRRTLRAS